MLAEYTDAELCLTNELLSRVLPSVYHCSHVRFQVKAAVTNVLKCVVEKMSVLAGHQYRMRANEWDFEQAIRVMTTPGMLSVMSELVYDFDEDEDSLYVSEDDESADIESISSEEENNSDLEDSFEDADSVVDGDSDADENPLDVSDITNARSSSEADSETEKCSKRHLMEASHHNGPLMLWRLILEIAARERLSLLFDEDRPDWALMKTMFHWLETDLRNSFENNPCCMLTRMGVVPLSAALTDRSSSSENRATLVQLSHSLENEQSALKSEQQQTSLLVDTLQSLVQTMKEQLSPDENPLRTPRHQARSSREFDSVGHSQTVDSLSAVVERMAAQSQAAQLHMQELQRQLDQERTARLALQKKDLRLRSMVMQLQTLVSEDVEESQKSSNVSSPTFLENSNGGAFRTVPIMKRKWTDPLPFSAGMGEESVIFRPIQEEKSSHISAEKLRNDFYLAKGLRDDDSEDELSAVHRQSRPHAEKRQRLRLSREETASSNASQFAFYYENQENKTPMLYPRSK